MCNGGCRIPVTTGPNIGPGEVFRLPVPDHHEAERRVRSIHLIVDELAQTRQRLDVLRKRREEATKLVCDADGELRALKEREARAAMELERYVDILAHREGV